MCRAGKIHFNDNSTEVQVSNRPVKSLANSTNSRNTEPRNLSGRWADFIFECSSRVCGIPSSAQLADPLCVASCHSH